MTITLPFSKVVHVDSELRDSVAELAHLVADLAAVRDDAESELLHKRAVELTARLDEG